MIRVVVQLLPAGDGEPALVATLDLSAVDDGSYRGEVRFPHGERPVRTFVESHRRRPLGWVPLLRRMLEETERELERRGLLAAEKDRNKSDLLREVDAQARLYDDASQPLQALMLEVGGLRGRLQAINETGSWTEQNALHKEALGVLDAIEEASKRLVGILRPAPDKAGR